MGFLKNLFTKSEPQGMVSLPDTWEDAVPHIMPVLSSQEGLDNLLASLRHAYPSISTIPITDRLDFFITYVIDLKEGMMTITNKHLEEWGASQNVALLSEIAFKNLIGYINAHKEIKAEGSDMMCFINTTPAPEDEYVASIAAFPSLLTEYLEQLGMTEAYVAFPNRYSIALGKVSEPLKLMLEFVIADFYPNTHVRKRVSRSVYHFKKGSDLEIIEIVTDEKIQELLAIKGQ